MRSTRASATALTVLNVAALLAAGCGAAAVPSAAPAAVSPSVQPGTSAPAASAPAASAMPRVGDVDALLLLGRPNDPKVHLIEARNGDEVMSLPAGVPNATWSSLLTAEIDGTRTTVRNIVPESQDDLGAPLTVDGAWILPGVGRDGMPSGRSADGSVAILAERNSGAYGSTVAASRFAVIRLGEGTRAPHLDRILSLPGTFDFDALSPNGSVLYVVEHLDGQLGGHYQVRWVDLRTGRMDPVPVADKTTSSEGMAGTPITQLRRDDGEVLTLYRGPEHPFVHLLDTVNKWAICIDLPAAGAGDATAAADWGLVGTPDGRSVYAVNASLGLIADIDPSQLAIQRSVTLPPAPAARAPGVVLAKFETMTSERVGRRVALDATGKSIVAGGRDGLVAVGTDDLSVDWRTATEAPVIGLAITPDGKTAFALLENGNVNAVSMADGSTMGSVPISGFDRLLGLLA